MGYFDDLTFINAGSAFSCTSKTDMRYPYKYSLQFTQSGKVSLGINQQPPVIREGPVAYLFLPENSYQYGPGDESGYHHRYINFWGPRGERIIRDGFQQLQDADGYIQITNVDEFLPVYVKLEQMVVNWKRVYQSNAVLSLEKLLSLMIDSQRLVLTAKPYHQKIQELALLIRNSPFQEWNFKEVASRHFFFSYSHFRRIFKEIMNQPPHNFLISCKIEKATHMLRQQNRSIKEIATACGFDDPARFSKLFKMKIGLSPRNYLLALKL